MTDYSVLQQKLICGICAVECLHKIEILILNIFELSTHRMKTIIRNSNLEYLLFFFLSVG